MGNSKSRIYREGVPDDLLEEIFLLLPGESIHICRSVSKHWRSILESKNFLERRASLQKSRPRILAVHDCDCARPPRLIPGSRFEGGVEIVNLHCDGFEPLMTCDGLVCFPHRDWISVLNPSTSQLRRFPTGSSKKLEIARRLWTYSIGDWSMGFGRDKVTGSYEVVKICYSLKTATNECFVLGLDIGEWIKLSPLPCYVVKLGAKSVCVNGSIYWLYKRKVGYNLLALDLHQQEFHDVSVPATWITYRTQIVNLEDRLVMTDMKQVGPEWRLEILTMDAEEERWSKTYSISLAHRCFSPTAEMFRPVAISKQRDLVFYDHYHRLYKYNSGTDEISCLSSNTRVIAPYIENLVRLPLKSSHPPRVILKSDPGLDTPKCPLFEPGSYSNALQPHELMIFFVLFICILLYPFT